MINIKLSTDTPGWPYLRQTPGLKGVWNDCVFWVNTNVDKCDWWFVYEGLVGPEFTKCDPKHIVFITAEPPVTRTYDPKFLAQFSAVITSHTDLAHSQALIMQQALPWHIGVDRDTRGEIIKFLSFDDLVKVSPENIGKSKLASVISSDKKYTRGHRRRIRFIEQLLDRLGDQVDFYGRGFNDIDDKWEAIAPYKYHIVLENSSIPHYFTEKLSDAFLGWSYPIYYGCPNIFDYFSPFSLSEIDILDSDQAIDAIERIINSNIFESRLSYIEEARKLVLERYNLFSLLSEYSEQNPSVSKTGVVLYPESHRTDLISRLQKSSRKLNHYGIGMVIQLFLEKYL
jgi:hypothetical protein